MTLRSYLGYLFGLLIISSVAFLTVVWTVEPTQSNGLTITLFYLTLAGGLASFFAIIGLFLRRVANLGWARRALIVRVYFY